MNGQQWPQTIKQGNATVKVYRLNQTATGKWRFNVVWRDEHNARRVESIGDVSAAGPLALAAARDRAAKLSGFGARVAATTGQDVSVLLACSDQLSLLGVRLPDAVRSLSGWLHTFKSLSAIDAALAVAQSQAGTAATVKDITVQQAVDDFIAEHETNGESSELHIRDMRSRLTRFAKSFVCSVSTITTPMLQEWLNNNNGTSANYEHNRRIVCNFFGWCYCHGFHIENPAATPKKHLRVPGKLYLQKRTVQAGKVRVFSPEEMSKLLAAASLEILPMLVFGGLCGLRMSEFARARWQDIDWQNKRMIVGENEGKTTESRRTFSLSENVLAYLADYKTRKGFIWTDRAPKFIQTIDRICTQQGKLAKAAGVPWKQNALRHAYISYRLVLKHPVADVATDAGNSPAVINRNYKSLRFDDGSFITEKDAQAWFNLKPNTK